jgi:hypothetical protein
MKKWMYPLMGLLVFSMVLPQDAWAQKKKKKKKDEQVEQGPKEGSIEAETKNCVLMDGLFPVFKDTTDGSLKMVISNDQLDQEFIHFMHVINGILEAGYPKGSYRGATVFSFEKYYDKIEFQLENESFYFDPDNPLSKAANANISKAILFSAEIKAEDEEKGLYLIEADGLLKSEALRRLNYSSRNPDAFSLGGLDGGKTKVRQVRNYPENSDFRIDYAFSNPQPRNYGFGSAADPRSVIVTIDHSFIAVPENDYVVRYEDPRIGYFVTQTEDMTDPSHTPYRDLVHRWNLIPKDPDAELSEPVEPIVWWIENTTPEEWRPVIAEAVLEWNKAFEKAGFKNAVQVQIQPDDAEWDAGDIRYNVLRWTSSPLPPWGGYGPSFVNPQTGQILGADVMLEFVYMTNRMRYDKLYSMNMMSTEMDVDVPEHSEHDSHMYCSMGHKMQTNRMFGQMAMKMAGATDVEMSDMLKEGLKELIMHEVGHTLGLNHNMKSSYLWSPEELYSKDVIEGKALTGSVMDYAVINVSPDRETQGHYYSPTVGPYDEWAIEWGYALADEDELNTIASRSNDPLLIFGNDADDMRSPGKAIDPRVNVDDLSNDPITYSVDRIELVNDMFDGVLEHYSEDGETYQEMRQGYLMLNYQMFLAAQVISRYVGGVYVDRSVQGQTEGVSPYQPVSLEDQQRAMDALKKYVFAPDAFDRPEEIYKYLAMQRRGFNFFMGPEDPKIHASALRTQQYVLYHLMHPNTMQRILDSEQYGNEYDLASMMNDLTAAIFSADISGNVNTFRQNLQVAYTEMLAGILANERGRYSNLAVSQAVYQLNKIDRMAAPSGNSSSRAHKEHLRWIVSQAMD